MNRRFLLLGSLFAFLGVSLGAFGAHALRDQLSTEMHQIYETAVKYQMYHSLALIAVAIISKFLNGRWIIWAGWLFLTGILIFSGSLYVLSLTGARWLGGFTPIGGLAFLTGWIFLMIQSIERKKD